MSDTIFREALVAILSEIFNGPPGEMAFLLNPGDPGLLDQLQPLDATAASTPPAPGRMTIAAHVDHILYGFTLLNRWAGGEENPWATADWNASWKRSSVTETEWRALIANLTTHADRWRDVVATKTDWDSTDAAGALSSAAHTAYHMGAIRQIVLAVKRDV